MGLELQLDSFTPLVGDTFGVRPSEGEPFEMVLATAEATPYGDPSAHEGKRMPFSLVFLAGDARLIPQQTCTFTHAEAGETDLFVVPLGPQDGAMRYEAVIA